MAEEINTLIQNADGLYFKSEENEEGMSLLEEFGFPFAKK